MLYLAYYLLIFGNPGSVAAHAIETSLEEVPATTYLLARSKHWIGIANFPWHIPVERAGAVPIMFLLHAAFPTSAYDRKPLGMPAAQ